jgi:hypothetical protein
MFMLHVHVSMLHVHAELSMLHVYAACPCCISLLRTFSLSMLHVDVSMLLVQAACPCCSSTLHLHAACPRSMYMLLVTMHAHTAYPP